MAAKDSTPTRKCLTCGSGFVPRGSISKFCTTECSFWAKVDKRSDSECWNWKAAVGKPGYGSFYRLDGQFEGAHRYSWRMVNGDIPEGRYICHTCDNRKCCNPNHLFLGEPKDNVADMWRKSRQQDYSKVQRGSKRHNAKLNADKVRSIRKMYPRMTKTEIANVFGVGVSAVSCVINGKTWKHVK